MRVKTQAASKQNRDVRVMVVHQRITCYPVTKQLGLFLSIMSYTSWYNRPKRVSLYLVLQKAGINVLSSLGIRGCAAFSHTPSCRGTLATAQQDSESPTWLSDKTTTATLAEQCGGWMGKAERSPPGRGCPLSKGSWVPGQLPATWSSCRISGKSKDRCFLCQGCHMTQFSLLCRLPKRSKWDPGCSRLPVGLLGTNNATRPSEQLARSRACPWTWEHGWGQGPISEAHSLEGEKKKSTNLQRKQGKHWKDYDGKNKMPLGDWGWGRLIQGTGLKR